ncbi:MAG: MHYT domain-containing protein [Inquilinaceae bacterium]
MPLELVYSPLLVLASLVVAVMAAFTTLRLTSNLRTHTVARRKMRVTQGALALGIGIWSMHFIGMLAVELPITISYSPLPTLASALIAVLVVGCGLLSLHFGVRTKSRIYLAGTLTGLGIVGMHYLGMSAISANCVISYDPFGVVLAIGIGILASIAAMELAYGTRSLRSIVAGSVVLGLAISAMHYSAMLFTSFSLGVETRMISDPLLNADQLALVVALSSFVISGLFLLSTVPGDPQSTEGPAVSDEADTRMPVSPPAGAAGVALSRAMTAKDGTGAVETPDAAPRIPYEREKTIRFMPSSAILAVQADGHYTRLHSGGEELFCPWSISRVEKCLAGTDFVRTHRSYIVNRRLIRGFKRDGDKAYCLVGDSDALKVPISRTRVPEVRNILSLG